MFGKLQRSIASPTMAKLWWQAFMEIDVRGVLGAVRTPTIVMGRPGDQLVSIEAVAALAAGIPNAQFYSLSPGPHNGFDIIDELIDHFLSFFVERPSAPADERVLKTVMFTDIVGSTEKLNAHGDAHWRHQLNNHDTVIDHMLSRYGGARANHTGDGIFALFDAPTRAARCALELVPAATPHVLFASALAFTRASASDEGARSGSGMAVHIGARIGALAGAGEVLASRTVRDLSAGSGLTFESLGPQRLKGLPEEVDLYRVTTPSSGLTP